MPFGLCDDEQADQHGSTEGVRGRRVVGKLGEMKTEFVRSRRRKEQQTVWRKMGCVAQTGALDSCKPLLSNGAALDVLHMITITEQKLGNIIFLIGYA